MVAMRSGRPIYALLHPVSQEFVSPNVAQDGSYALGKTHIYMRSSTPSLRSLLPQMLPKMVAMRSGRPICAPPPRLSGVCFPNVALETVPMLVWLTDGPFSRPVKEDRSFSASSFEALI